MKRLPTQQGHLFNRHHSIYDGPRKRVLIHLCQKNKRSNGGDKVNGKCQTCLPCWGRQPCPAFIINTTGSHYGNPSLSCCKFNCAKICSKSERRRKKKKNNQGAFAAFHSKCGWIVRFPDKTSHRRGCCARVPIIMKVPLIGALSSVVQQKLADYERAKWDGFSRCSPSVREHALRCVRVAVSLVDSAARPPCMTIMRAKLPPPIQPRNAHRRFKLPRVTE